MSNAELVYTATEYLAYALLAAGVVALAFGLWEWWPPRPDGKPWR